MIINPQAKQFTVLDLRVTETGIDILLGGNMLLANGDQAHVATLSIPLHHLANFGNMTGAAIATMRAAHASANPGTLTEQ